MAAASRADASPRFPKSSAICQECQLTVQGGSSFDLRRRPAEAVSSRSASRPTFTSERP